MNTFAHFVPYLARFFLKLEIFESNNVGNIRTHILCSFFYPENRARFIRIMWNKIVESDRPQVTVCHGACTLHAG
jgi:hypothetical protein